MAITPQDLEDALSGLRTQLREEIGDVKTELGAEITGIGNQAGAALTRNDVENIVQEAFPDKSNEDITALRREVGELRDLVDGIEAPTNHDADFLELRLRIRNAEDLLGIPREG